MTGLHLHAKGARLANLGHFVRTPFIMVVAATLALHGGVALGQVVEKQGTDVAPVTVTAQKRTKPWRPTESPVPEELRTRGTELCNVIAQDPQLRWMAEKHIESPRIYEATRFPRNPDYSAPPITPVGSPFPEVFSVKDYLKTGVAQSLAGTAADDGGAESGGLDAAPGFGDTTEGIVAACMMNARAGVDFKLPGENLPPSGGSPPRAFAGGPQSGDHGRLQIKARDKSLPLGFALFEHGRYEEALEQFKAAYRKLPLGDGGDEAALTIGKIYLFGLKEKSDPVEGVAWLKRAAGAPFNPARMMPRFDPREPERNTAVGEAAMILADIYSTGRGPVAKDPTQTRRYLERAIEVGHVPAGMSLGEMYYNGVGAPKDLKKAFESYMSAASFAYAPAAVAVAQMYASGEAPGGRDLAKAVVWSMEAAKLDHPEGLHGVAVAYDRGEGVSPNPQLALAFYKRAAARGDAASQAAIGTYFYQGEDGVPQDLVLARKWFERAAVGGDADGMFNLAAMQAKGEGGEVDRVKAWGWLKIADKLGHANASAAARALEGEFTPQERAGIAALSAKRPG
jgi:TPR repeat protein